MARIVINEKDLTTATKAPDTTDIVFVPGLMGFTLGSRDGLQGKKYTPTLCQTVTAFENYFGKEPYQFQNAETYNGIEVEAGDFDPGYIYAKELLAAGLQVVYEALDESISQEEYSLVKSQPSGFTENYTSYYTKGTLTPITNWDDAKDYIYKKDSSDNYVAVSRDSQHNGSLLPALKDSSDNYIYYNITNNDEDLIQIPQLGPDQKFTVSWSDKYVLNKSSSGNIHLKQTDSVSANSEFYLCYKTDIKPNITAKNTTNETSNRGLVIDSNGDIQYYNDAGAPESGWLCVDKSGNYYYIAGTGKAVRNSTYAFDATRVDEAHSGADYQNIKNKVGQYFFNSDGIMVTPDNATGYVRKTSTTNIANIYSAYLIDSSGDVAVQSYSYIDSLNGVYQKNNLEQQTVLSKIYSQLFDVYHTEVMADSDIPSLNEKGEYSIKYITSGGYPNYGSNIGIYNQMMNLAADRGDAVALVDAVCEKSRTLNPKNDQSLYYKLQLEGISDGSFGTMMFPWVNVNLLNIYGKNQIKPKTDALMPASFAYLKCLATSLKQGNPNWLSIAGVTRGLVSNLVSDNPIETDKPVTNAIADYYQGTQPNGDAVSNTEFKYAINAITNIKPYGYCIWGNRTLATNVDGQKATNYLNIRNLVSDIKKICYTSARRLMFEQNDDILWTKFLSYVTPTLDKMNSGSGVSGYKVIKLATDEHAKLAAKIIIFPVYAVENFEITVELKDEEITVEE